MRKTHSHRQTSRGRTSKPGSLAESERLAQETLVDQGAKAGHARARAALDEVERIRLSNQQVINELPRNTEARRKFFAAFAAAFLIRPSPVFHGRFSTPYGVLDVRSGRGEHCGHWSEGDAVGGSGGYGFPGVVQRQHLGDAPLGTPCSSEPTIHLTELRMDAKLEGHAGRFTIVESKGVRGSATAPIESKYSGLLFVASRQEPHSIA